MDAVIELKTQLEILQTKIRIKERRLMDKMNIVKKMKLAQEKELDWSLHSSSKTPTGARAPSFSSLAIDSQVYASGNLLTLVPKPSQGSGSTLMQK